MKNDLWYMNLALEEAEKAYKLGEVPVGCIIIDEDDNILSKSYNLKEEQNDTTAHAEIIGIRKASTKIGDWRLKNCTVYISLEPCPMCLYALMQARVKKVVFGAYDFKAGAISLGHDLYNDSRFNHKFKVVGGVEHFRCSKMLSTFFRERRKAFKK